LKKIWSKALLNVPPMIFKKVEPLNSNEDLQRIGLKIIRQYKEQGLRNANSFIEVEYLKTSNA